MCVCVCVCFVLTDYFIDRLLHICSFQHGGVRSAVHTPGHHGERTVPVPGQHAAPEEQVW